MAKPLRDFDILNLIGDGNLSEIEVGESEDDDECSLTGVLSPRIQEVEEEIVMDDNFENELNNMVTVNDVIDAVVRGEIGLDLPSGGTARVNRFFNPPLSDNKEIAAHGRGYAEEVEVEAFQKYLNEHGGHYGGWKVKDHLFFLKMKKKYPLNKTAETVNKHFPGYRSLGRVLYNGRRHFSPPSPALP
ncbi:hypothetical protein J6590_013168 [Homalodisca vitripennis]|nr:hypothetical protein J6590_013168 [Homalodisca vitripennis]